MSGVAVRAGLFEQTDAGVTLLGDRCRACDAHQFPRAGICTLCGAPDPVPVQLAATGTLWAWTWVTAPPPGYDGPVPYGFGVVELPEGLRVITRLVLDPDVAPTVGQPMRAVLDTVGTDPESGHDLVSWAFSPLDASVGL